MAPGRTWRHDKILPTSAPAYWNFSRKNASPPAGMSEPETAPDFRVLVEYSTRLVTVFQGPFRAGATCVAYPSAGNVQVIHLPTPGGTQWMAEGLLTRQT